MAPVEVGADQHGVPQYGPGEHARAEIGAGQVGGAQIEPGDVEQRARPSDPGAERRRPLRILRQAPNASPLTTVTHAPSSPLRSPSRAARPVSVLPTWLAWPARLVGLHVVGLLGRRVRLAGARSARRGRAQPGDPSCNVLRVVAQPGRFRADHPLQRFLRHPQLSTTPDRGEFGMPNSLYGRAGDSITNHRKVPLEFGTSKRPNSRKDNPLSTGNQARKDLIESEPPERETREGEPERRRGNRTRKSLIESGTRNTEGKRPEESPRG